MVQVDKYPIKMHTTNSLVSGWHDIYFIKKKVETCITWMSGRHAAQAFTGFTFSTASCCINHSKYSNYQNLVNLFEIIIITPDPKNIIELITA